MHDFIFALCACYYQRKSGRGQRCTVGVYVRIASAIAVHSSPSASASLASWRRLDRFRLPLVDLDLDGVHRYTSRLLDPSQPIIDTYSDFTS